MTEKSSSLLMNEDPDSLFEGGVIARIEAMAAANPQGDALYFMDQTLSYKELDLKANRIAHGLAGLNVGSESLVGLLFNRSPKLIEGLLGILKAGAAYLPLDPAYPADRLLFMVQDSGASVILTERQSADLIPDLNIPIILI